VILEINKIDAKQGDHTKTCEIHISVTAAIRADGHDQININFSVGPQNAFSKYLELQILKRLAVPKQLHR
jgi:hypothetical protein